MTKRKLGRFRIDGPATGGTPAIQSCGVSGGGLMCKDVLYMAKIIAASSDQAKLGLSLSHGPDGQVFRLHSIPITNTRLTGADALLLVGQADLSLMIGDFLEPTLTCISNDNNACWVVAEVFEFRKPF